MSEQALYKVSDFFDSYARALEGFDTKAMAQHYMLPCLFMSDDNSTMFTEASKLEGLFNQGTGFYKQFGITHARPEVWSKRAWTDRIVKCKVNWQYFDANNKPIYDCDYQYVLKVDKQDKIRIEVSVSINEKEKMQKWQSANTQSEGS
ncbi:MAG: hypothetical protein EOP56_13490 [Sphingobacteriales bacterium]|nr:MAG: hypothetical protein EOP56_13490 [Sphingobacteriales bacterium]